MPRSDQRGTGRRRGCRRGRWRRSAPTRTFLPSSFACMDGAVNELPVGRRRVRLAAEQVRRGRVGGTSPIARRSGRRATCRAAGRRRCRRGGSASTPSMASSSITIAADGQPMPLDWTDTGLPSERAGVSRACRARSFTSPGVFEERLGDVLRPQRVAGEEAGVGVVAGLGTEVDRHGATILSHRCLGGARCSSRAWRRSSRSAPRSRSSASSSRTWRAAASAGSCALAATGADRALPRRRERRTVRARAARRSGERPRRARADGDRRGAGRRRALGARRRESCPRRATTGPDSPSTCSTSRLTRGDTGSARRRRHDLDLLVPACAAAHEEEIGINPLDRDPDGFRWRTHAQIGEGRSWLWARERHDPLQGGGVRLDASRRPAAAGLGRPGCPRHGASAARHARPLPPTARAGAARLPVRPRGKRTCDPRLRGDRHAPHDLLPQPHLLTHLSARAVRRAQLVCAWAL